MGAAGRVDLYAWPTLFRVMLLRSPQDETWAIRTDSGLRWPNPWSEETFAQLALGLLGEQ
jgi:hypothetical protein